MDMPTVSIVVPNYNHARFLRQRLDSVLGQTYQDFELILLDDCSTDESRTILEEYARDPRVRLAVSELNSGTPFKQWNKGVQMAQGKYVWIAESDDYAEARFLDRMVAVLEGRRGVQFVFCRSWRVDSDGQLQGFAMTPYPEEKYDRWEADFVADGREECRRYMARACYVQNASAVVFRKAAYDLTGGADESLRICGDWKLWCSLMLNGEMAYVAEPLNYFRTHNATARSRFGLWRAGIVEWLTVVRWILDQAPPDEESLRAIRAHHADLWVPALLSMEVPWSIKGEIFRRARAIDPHPIRAAGGPALETLRLKFGRTWRELRSIVNPART
jgi:glycosyltransferase involved in cell wall biosynthesis